MRPKPRHLKLLSGTVRPDRDEHATPQLEPLDELPSPPAWLPNAHATAEYRRLAAILGANRMLTRGNLALLAHLAALHGRVVEAYARGETPPAAHLSQLRALHGDLGLLGMRAHKREGAPGRFAAHRARPRGE